MTWGRTWSTPYLSPFASAINSITHRDCITAVSDADFNVYLAGGYSGQEKKR